MDKFQEKSQLDPNKWTVPSKVDFWPPCLCPYTCTHMNMYTHTRTHAHTYINTYAHTHEYICVCMHTHTHTLTHKGKKGIQVTELNGDKKPRKRTLLELNAVSRVSMTLGEATGDTQTAAQALGFYRLEELWSGSCCAGILGQLRKLHTAVTMAQGASQT